MTNHLVFIIELIIETIRKMKMKLFALFKMKDKTIRIQSEFVWISLN